MAQALSAHLLPLLPEEARGRLPAGEELERLLAEVLRLAERGLPEAAVPPEVFLPFLARRAAAALADGVAPLALQLGDLYVLCAYLQGHRAAQELFSTAYLPQVEGALRRIGAPQDALADLRQFALQQLLLEPAREGGQGGYAGRGSLLGWMCVSAVRRSRTLLLRAGRERPLGDGLETRLASSAADPELSYLRSLYGGELQAALTEALGSLSARERNLLRYHYVEGLSTEQVAALYQVHRTSAGRWIEKARQRVLRHTQRALLGRIRVRPSELQSIVRLVQSQIELSLGAALGG